MEDAFYPPCGSCGHQSVGNRYGQDNYSRDTHFCPSKGEGLSTGARTMILGLFALIAVIGALLIGAHYAPQGRVLLDKIQFAALHEYTLPIGGGAVAIALVGAIATFAIDRNLREGQ